MYLMLQTNYYTTQRQPSCSHQHSAARTVLQYADERGKAICVSQQQLQCLLFFIHVTVQQESFQTHNAHFTCGSTKNLKCMEAFFWSSYEKQYHTKQGKLSDNRSRVTPTWASSSSATAQPRPARKIVNDESSMKNEDTI